MTPSAILSRAADLIRDTAAAATPGPWTAVESDHHTHYEYGEMTDDDAFPPIVGEAREPLGAWVSAVSGAKIGAGCSDCMSGTIGLSNAPWIALMSPAIAPMIEKWLRDTASYFDEFADYWVSIPEQARDALALARAVLGEKEEQ